MNYYKANYDLINQTIVRFFRVLKMITRKKFEKTYDDLIKVSLDRRVILNYKKVQCNWTSTNN